MVSSRVIKSMLNGCAIAKRKCLAKKLKVIEAGRPEVTAPLVFRDCI